MRKLIIREFVSLDGVIQAPGGPEEDSSDGFRFGGWVVPYSDEAASQDLMEQLAQPFELLLGRRTYDIFAGYWPRVPAEADNRIANTFNRAPKHVATHRPGALDWHNSHPLQGDLAEAVRALKQQGGADLLTFGSGDMVQQLLAAGLVDELQLLIFPVVLGRGRRLFGDDALASSFKLTRSAITADGVLVTRYARDGEVRTGSFGASD